MNDGIDLIRWIYGARCFHVVAGRDMYLDQIELTKLLTNRNDSAERAELARSGAQTSIAEGFDRLTAEFDALIARYRVAFDGGDSESAVAIPPQTVG